MNEHIQVGDDKKFTTRTNTFGLTAQHSHLISLSISASFWEDANPVRGGHVLQCALIEPTASTATCELEIVSRLT